MNKIKVLLTVIVMFSIFMVGGCTHKLLTLTTSVTPAGGGTVSPNGGTYNNGVKETLKATPSQYYVFTGWAGDLSGMTNPITMTMNTNKNIVAMFSRITYTLETLVGASGGGSIDPASGSFEAGNQVVITATPASGYRFDHWDGSATGTTNPLSVLMDGDKTITAYFVQQFSLTTSSNPASGGNIIVTPSNSVYDKGTQVTLNANQQFPYAFVNWTGTDNNNAYSTTVTMSGNKSVTCNYVETTAGAWIGNWITDPDVTIYTSSSRTITINLQLYQYCEINIAGGIFTTQIKDPNGKVIQSFNTQTVTCTFAALVAGQYTVVTQNPSSMTNTAYRSQYRIYTH